jgi:hypothetical protein
MNLNAPSPKTAVPAIVGAVLLSAAVFSAAAQPAGGTDFAPFQLIGQRNIFDPNRVPRLHSAARPTSPVADSFSFVGTLSYAKGTFAFFDGTSPDFRKVLELDGGIADFKVAAITPKAVTLLSGTNETVLPLGTQMYRDDDGHWVVSTGTAAYASVGNSPTSASDRRASHRRRSNSSGSGSDNASTTSPDTIDNSPSDNPNAASDGTPDTGTEVTAPDTSSPPGGGANDALTRLMRQRAQEEQQLGSGPGQ